MSQKFCIACCILAENQLNLIDVVEFFMTCKQIYRKLFSVGKKNHKGTLVLSQEGCHLLTIMCRRVTTSLKLRGQNIKKYLTFKVFGVKFQGKWVKISKNRGGSRPPCHLPSDAPDVVHRYLGFTQPINICLAK